MIESFLITLREGMEAALIIGIIAAYLAKIGRRDLSKYLYGGAGFAILASAMIAVFVSRIYGGLEGRPEELFEGIASLTAVVVLSYMIVWMAVHSKHIKKELEKNVEVAISTGELIKIASLSFIVVFREGVETVLFLTAAAINEPGSTLLGFILAIAVVIALASALFRGVYTLDIGRFFKYTSFLLILFAAGITANGIHALQEAKAVPIIVWEDSWKAGHYITEDGIYENLPSPWASGVRGAMLGMLFGYHGTGTPSFFMLLSYIAYWAVMSSYVLKAYKIKEIKSAEEKAAS